MMLLLLSCGTSAVVGAVASEVHEAARIPVACFCGQHEKYSFAVHAGKWRLSLLL